VGVALALAPPILHSTGVSTGLPFVHTIINYSFGDIFQCLLASATGQAAEAGLNHPAGFTVTLLCKFLAAASSGKITCVVKCLHVRYATLGLVRKQEGYHLSPSIHAITGKHSRCLRRHGEQIRAHNSLVLGSISLQLGSTSNNLASLNAISASGMMVGSASTTSSEALNHLQRPHSICKGK
jgi:hypothetical protein